MLRTPVCDLLGIEVPVVAAPFGPWGQVELAAAVSAAGGLGSVGTALRERPELEAQWARVRELTDRPFAINHTVRPFDEEAFAATLRFRPAAISFHLGVPDDLVARAHDASSRRRRRRPQGRP
jgi:enoyl-[acyl-carrier protein] reductase II